MKQIIFLYSVIFIFQSASFAQGKISGTGFEYYNGDSTIELEYSLNLTVNEDLSGSMTFDGIPELEGMPVTFKKFRSDTSEAYTSSFKPWGYNELNLFKFQDSQFGDAKVCIFHFDFIPLQNKYEIKILDGVKLLYKFEIHVLNFDDWKGSLFFKREFDFLRVNAFTMVEGTYKFDKSFDLGYHVELTDTAFVLMNKGDLAKPVVMKIFSVYVAEDGFELIFFDNNDRIMIPNKTPIPEIALSILFDKEKKIYQQIHIITD